jgi:YidC/Oxa1 family membrane protein insertase
MLVVANIFQPLIDVADAILNLLHDVGFAYGAAIVGLTFITRIAILPLSIKQIRSMREMAVIQPQLKEIQQRYKDDRERLQRESMRLFQEHGVNPFASCLPLFLQLPVFLALFYLLQGDDFKNEVRSAGEESWLFINDLTEKATGEGLALLLVLYVGTSLAAGLIMSGGRQASGQQRMIAMGLPLAFAPIMIIYGFPAGLWVYWISTNFWTVGQQAVIRVFFPPEEQPTPEEVRASRPPPPPPRKRKRRR